ncbi:putative ATP synthase subunit f, mitochondrial [Hypsibius exemplaris]|uniref:ATP synthase subunit f, mitochondrial n=1 Tax=Hypsibius exemplaris TaxID=2072580 RepID=A0A1W0W8S1_HYPEX|nr:putative ATP synthase subunit f, mitochondrial [Hypsibius exemplaris]
MSFIDSLSSNFKNSLSGKTKFTYFGIGAYPVEFNRRIHGPYDPARFYGKPVTPFGQVKIGELPAWLSRRSLNPVAMSRAVSRGYWRWFHKYVAVRYGTAAPYVQFAVGLSALFYCINYKTIRLHSQAKYH